MNLKSPAFASVYAASAVKNTWLRNLGNGESLVQALKEECSAHGGSKVVVATVDGEPRRFAVTNALGPIDLVLTDVNGDGIGDAAAANERANNVSIYLGKADGSFGAATEFVTGTRPQSIEAGDFNRDGRTDLVTANAGNPIALVGDVSLLLGDGNGGFAAPQSLAVGKLPFDVVTADFNRDGKLDLAVADYDYETQTIALRLGNGDGSFQPTQTFPVPELAESLVTADLNDDKNPDLVSNGAVLLGNGAGGFQPASRFPLGAPPYLVRVGDLNADAKPDVVLASGGSNNIGVLLNQGDGSLAPPQYYVTGNNPAEVAIVDLDDDGKIDLLVSNKYDDHLTLLYGKGDGSFSGLPAYSALAYQAFFSYGATDVTAADFSGDGIADLLVANNNQRAALLPGLGQGRFAEPVYLPWNSDGIKVVSGDWNSDGKADAAFLNAGSYPNLIVSLGQGNGDFATPTSIALSAPLVSNFPFLASAHLNSDSYPDLISSNSSRNALSLLLGNGAGGFTLQSALAVGVLPVAAISADFNGDGKPDLAIANFGDNESAPNGGLQLALGNGDGSYQTAQSVRAGVSSSSLVAADFNLDGKNDLAAIVTSADRDDVEFFAGLGNGAFAAPQALGLNLGRLAGLQVADADQDGKPDLGLGTDGSRAVGLRGNGDGSFTLTGFLYLGGYGDAKLAQLNDDTQPDLIATGGFNGFVAACLSQDCPLSAPSSDGGSAGSSDPFLCWQTAPANAPRGQTAYPKFSPVNLLAVADALGTASVSQARKMNLIKPAQLCNPVAIGQNATEIVTHAGHLAAYLSQPAKTKPAQTKFLAKTVAIRNQLGKLSLSLSAPTSLLVPSAKAVGPGGATPLGDDSPDHFQCYKAKVAKARSGQAALPTFTPTELLLQDDQAGPLRFKLAAPTRLCAPASLDDNTAAAFNHADWLACYPLQWVNTKPAQAKPAGQVVSIHNRFGDEVLESKVVKELCLPTQSEK